MRHRNFRNDYENRNRHCNSNVDYSENGFRGRMNPKAPETNELGIHCAETQSGDNNGSRAPPGL